jgi:SLT domain-containing protein
MNYNNANKDSENAREKIDLTQWQFSDNLETVQ